MAEAFDLPYNNRKIATVAYRAEHDELGIPCGMMDQFASSLGNMFYMKCLEEPITERLRNEFSGLVIGNTLIKKKTINVHKSRVKEMRKAIFLLSKYIDVNLDKIDYDESITYLEKLPLLFRNRLIAAIKNRDITLEAKKELKRKKLNHQRIGELLNEHQMYLRDFYEVSIPEIEKIISVGIKNGAQGGKLTGAGMGGSVILYAPENETKVANSIRKAGFKAYIVKLDEGARAD